MLKNWRTVRDNSAGKNSCWSTQVHTEEKIEETPKKIKVDNIG